MLPQVAGMCEAVATETTLVERVSDVQAFSRGQRGSSRSLEVLGAGRQAWGRTGLCTRRCCRSSEGLEKAFTAGVAGGEAARPCACAGGWPGRTRLLESSTARGAPVGHIHVHAVVRRPSWRWTASRPWRTAGTQGAVARVHALVHPQAVTVAGEALTAHPARVRRHSAAAGVEAGPALLRRPFTAVRTGEGPRGCAVGAARSGS